jgi:hypothetical protein
MSFKDHPVFPDQIAARPGGDAVIIGIHDLPLLRTAARLAKLSPADWSVVQHPAMPADQLVVGTGGVYAVTTARLVGKVLIGAGVMLHNGHCTDHLSRVQDRAARIAARLDVPVRALLVVDTEALHVRDEPAEVGVTSSHRVRTWLECRPPALDGATVARVTALAQRAGTWR